MSTTPQWANDPYGRHQLRYWDGQRWTEHVSDGGRTSTDPPVAAARPEFAADLTVTSRARPAATGGTVWSIVLDDGTRREVPELLVLGRNPTREHEGRPAETMIVTDERQTVSKTHLAIGVTGGNLWATDLHSSNGTTFTAGGVVTVLRPGVRTPIPEGALVEVGGRTIRVEAVVAEVAPARPNPVPVEATTPRSAPTPPAPSPVAPSPVGVAPPGPAPAFSPPGAPVYGTPAPWGPGPSAPPGGKPGLVLAAIFIGVGGLAGFLTFNTWQWKYFLDQFVPGIVPRLAFAAVVVAALVRTLATGGQAGRRVNPAPAVVFGGFSVVLFGIDRAWRWYNTWYNDWLPNGVFAVLFILGLLALTLTVRPDRAVGPGYGPASFAPGGYGAPYGYVPPGGYPPPPGAVPPPGYGPPGGYPPPPGAAGPRS